MNRTIKLNENDLRRTVKSVLYEMSQDAGADSLVSQFAEHITNLDSNSAEFIARELLMFGCADAMKFLINHDNGYGYGGPDVNGNYDY